MFHVGSLPARARPVAQTTNSSAAMSDFMFPSTSWDPRWADQTGGGALRFEPRASLTQPPGGQQALASWMRPGRILESAHRGLRARADREPAVLDNPPTLSTGLIMRNHSFIVPLALLLAIGLLAGCSSTPSGPGFGTM